MVPRNQHFPSHLPSPWIQNHDPLMTASIGRTCQGEKIDGNSVWSYTREQARYRVASVEVLVEGFHGTPSEAKHVLKVRLGNNQLLPEGESDGKSTRPGYAEPVHRMHTIQSSKREMMNELFFYAKLSS